MYKPYDYIDKVEKLALNNELKGYEMFSGIYEEKVVSISDSHFIANVPIAYHKVMCTKTFTNTMLAQFNNVNFSNVFEVVKTGYDEVGNVILGNDNTVVYLDNKYFKLFEKDITNIYATNSKDLVYLFNDEYLIGIILPIVKR